MVFEFSRDGYASMFRTAIRNLATLVAMTLVAASFADSAKIDFGGHSYQRFDTPMSWTNAKAFCEARGAHLATVTSAAEQSFIRSFFGPGVVFLGATDLPTGIWHWITGEPWSFTAWDPGEPFGVGEHVLATATTSNNWNNVIDAANFPPLCEWENLNGSISSAGLVAHFAFDGNANDDSGNANNGTVVGGATFTSGKTGSALAITNGTQYVSGPNVTVGTSFSFAGWYKIDSAQTVQGTIGQWYSFFNTSQYCGTTLLGMMYNRPSGYIRIYPAGSGCSGAHDIPVTLPLDAWFHFATTYDGTAIRTYVNGVLIDQFAYTASIVGSQQLIVGASVPNVAYNWIGAIDDVYVFSRPLAAAEIATLANVNTSGPVSHYPFNGNASDIGTNGNNGTPAGSVSFASGTYATFNPVATDGSGWITAAPPINRDTSMSFAVWLRPSYIDAGGLGIVYERALGGGDSCGINSAGNFALEITTGKFAFATSTLSGATCTWSRTFSTTVPQIGQWMHVAGVYDKVGTRKIYINGVLESTTAVGTSLRTVSGATLRIGRNEVNVASQLYHGDMDDLRFYDRALSSAEITSFAGAQPVQVRVLNDTGQTLCYDASNAAVACSASVGGDGGVNPRQDARYGRDAQATSGQLTKVGGGAAAFDFTKVCMNGDDAGVGSCPAAPTSNSGANPAPTDWACTRDNLTGLVWSLQAFVSMSWEGANSTATSATNRCNFSTAWRLPSATELEGIVDYGRATSPSVDVNYFPGTANASYWAATLDANLASGAWNVRFSDGGADRQLKSYLYSVRLVRSTQ